MNTTLAKFMGLAITAVVIVALVFGVLYTSLNDKTTNNSSSFKETVDGTHVPTTTTIWNE